VKAKVVNPEKQITARFCIFVETALNMWHERDQKLIREFRFKDFNEAFTFMTCVALLAEKMGHHPTFYNTYNFVRIELSTHDDGDRITEKDQALARAIDRVLN
jgi:4a-hydroxytetrahydrobiopterin dehydratase